MSAQTTHGPEIRTYRGRNLEELIPRIREELGPDAIILREREGLTGGINGFFAQRCVEVDVQAPGGPVPPGIDFYDEEHDALPGASDPWAERAPAPAASTFAEPAAEPEPAPVAFAEPEPERVAAPQPAAEPEPASATPLEALTFAERLAQARREHDAALGAAPQAPAERSVADELAALAAPSSSAATTPAPAPAARRPTPTPYPTGVRGKVRVRPKTARPAAATAAAPAAATRRRTGTPGPGAQLDPVAAGAVARELIARGISEAWAHELIVSASAHLTPFAQHGSLRDAVRAGMAAGIAAPPLLPSSGAAVAFVGAGGAGKSRCAAAMAAA